MKNILIDMMSGLLQFGQLSAGKRKYYQTIKLTHKYNLHHQQLFLKSLKSVLGWIFALRLFHCFTVFQIWHTGASVCSVLVFLW